MLKNLLVSSFFAAGLLLLVSGLWSLVSLSAFAQNQTAEVDLTRAPDIASYGSSGGSVVQWIQNFYVFSLIGGVFLAVGVITWAGLRYAIAAGNPSTQADARDQILQSLLGLLLLFGAYLILYVINPGLVQLKFPTLQGVIVQGPPTATAAFQCVVSAGDSGPITTGLYNTINECNAACGPAGGACSQTTVSTPKGTVAGPTGGLTESQVREAFGQNIQIKPGARIEGMKQSIVDETIALQKNCGCNVRVTDATGEGHAIGVYSHANGYKVDLSFNTKLNDYITQGAANVGETNGNGFTRIADRVNRDGSRNLQWRASDGAAYAKEGDHWDVLKI